MFQLLLVVQGYKGAVALATVSLMIPQSAIVPPGQKAIPMKMPLPCVNRMLWNYFSIEFSVR